MGNVKDQLSRMKSMMTYGLTTENKNQQYSSIEHQKIAADGKMYGIVREGTKYYIKVANTTNNPLKENYDYIGGFRNRKDYEYSSFANALKNFDMKMLSIKESVGSKEPLIESWNPDRKEELTLEATEKMRKEIARQRQIMFNTALIQEKKNYEIDKPLEEGCCGVGKECSASQKNNIKKTSDGKGEPTGNGGDPFTQKVDKEKKDSQKTNIKNEYKPVMEGEEVLAWNDNEDYLDTSKGTEIGDTAPYTEKPKCCGNKGCEEKTVDEGVAMHNQDNQNKPEVGTGEIGDTAPYTEKADNALEESTCAEADDFDDEDSSDADGMSDEEMQADDFEGAEDNDFSDEDMVDDEAEEDASGDDDRLANLEELVMKIAEKLGISVFDDDSLYGDEDTEDELGAEDADADDFGDEDAEEEPVDDVEDEDDDFEVYESKNFKKMMKEEHLDYFGKHPAYRKEPMTTPSNNHQEKEGYHDMNDDSVENEQPYGEKIGDGKPFSITPDEIQNAITESIMQFMKKKI